MDVVPIPSFRRMHMTSLFEKSLATQPLSVKDVQGKDWQTFDPKVLSYQDVRYLYMGRVIHDRTRFFILLRLNGSKVVGIDALNPGTGEIIRAGQMGAATCEDSAALLDFSYFEQVIIGLVKNREDKRQIIRALNPLRPIIAHQSLDLRKLMRNTCQGSETLRSTLDRGFLRRCGKAGDMVELLAEFMKAYVYVRPNR